MTFMKMNPILRAVTVLSGLLFTHAGMASDADAGAFNLTRLSPGVYVHQGRHLGTDDSGRDDIANIGFITGDTCIAVIDTGGSVAVGAALKRAIRAISDLPICYVINTHVHFDHVLGNAAFRDTGAQFVGHEDLPSAMEQSRAFFLSEFAAELGANAGPDTIIAPDITVTGELQLELGNRTLSLLAHPPAHSYSDLSVYDEKSGALWLADLLFTDRLPTLDGSLTGWLETLARLKPMAARHVIPGHGDINLSWPAALAEQQRYLELLLRETREQLSLGTFMEDAVEIIGQEEKTRWLLYEETHGRNVIRAFRELEWE